MSKSDRISDDTKISLISKDISYIKEDISEIKTYIKELNNIFATRENLTIVAKEVEQRLCSLENKSDIQSRLLYIGLGIFIAVEFFFKFLVK